MLVADSSDAAAIGAALRAEHGLACRKYVGGEEPVLGLCWVLVGGERLRVRSVTRMQIDANRLTGIHP